MDDSKSLDLVQEYEDHRAQYEACTIRFAQLIREILYDERSAIAQIEHRTKEIDSLRDKVLRKPKSSGSLSEITDLCGIRIITYYLEDVELIAQKLEQEFEVDWDNSVDKAADLDPDRFGYQSTHYVLRLNWSREDQPEYRACHGYWIEVQIRTVLQHAWAAIDHKLRYKKDAEAPRELRRGLFRLSALLELADDQFSGLRHQWNDLYGRYQEEVSRGEFSSELNRDSLLAYFESGSVLSQWHQIGAECGLPMSDVESEQDANESNLTLLLQLLDEADVQRLDAVHSALEDSPESLREYLRSFAERLDHTENDRTAPSMFVILLVLTKAFENQITKQSFYKLGYPPDVDHIVFELCELQGPDPYDDFMGEEAEEDSPGPDWE